MKNILCIIKSDALKIIRNPMVLLLTVLICFLPALYAWLNIYACWDPYKNVSDMKIAVYSEDRDYTLEDGTVVNMSDELLQELSGQYDIGWTPVKSRSEAVDGVYDGTYYGGIIIEKNFTAEMFDFEEVQEKGESPTITFYQNQKKNAIATRMTDKAATTLKRCVSRKYIKALMTTVFGHFNIWEQDLESFGADTDGSQDSLAQLKTNMDRYQKSVTAFVRANRLMSGTLDSTEVAVDEAVSSIHSSIANMNTQKEYTKQIKKDLDDDMNNVTSSLKSLDSNMNELSGIITKISETDGVEDLSGMTEDSKALLKENVDMLENIQKILEISAQADGDLDDVVFTVCDGTEYLLNQTQSLLDYINLHYSELTGMQSALEQVLTQAVTNACGKGYLTPEQAQSLKSASTSKIVEALLTGTGTALYKKGAASGDMSAYQTFSQYMEACGKDSTKLMMLALKYAGIDSDVLTEIQTTYGTVSPVIQKIEKRAGELQTQYEFLQKDLNIVLGGSANLLEAAGVETAQDAMLPMQNQIKTDLEDTVAQLEALTKLSQGSAATQADLLEAETKLKYTKTQIALIRKVFDGIETDVPAAEAEDLVDVLKKLEKNLDEIDGVLGSAQKLLDTSGDATAVIAEASAMSQQTVHMIQQELQPALDKTFDNMEEIMDDVSALLLHASSTLKSGKDVLGGMNLTMYGMNNSLSAVQDALSALALRIDPLINDIEDIQDAEIIQDLKVLMGLNPEKTADFFATPVEVETTEIYPVDTYGSGMSPFYTSIAIWIGNIILAALFMTSVRNVQLQNPKPWERFFGRYTLFLVLNEVQACIIILGNFLFLKMQCKHPLLFTLTGMLSALTFSMLIYAMVHCFGIFGKGFAVLLFIMQIAGSGGTYPVQLLPATFQALYRFLPFEYSIQPMRSCIAGIYQNDYLWYLVVLLLYTALGIFLGLHADTFRGFVEHMKKQLQETRLL